MDSRIRPQLRFAMALSLAACTGCAQNDERDATMGGPTLQSSPAAETEEGPADAREIAIERHREQMLSSRFGDYPFRAVSMRIHPLTRVVVQTTDSGRLRMIEARLEFSDQFGDTTKAFGDLRFELYARPNGGSRTLSESDLLLKWEPEFSRIAVSAAHFDSVTRTYLYRLEIEEGLIIPDECVLVTHVRSFNDELEARIDLSVPQIEGGP